MSDSAIYSFPATINARATESSLMDVLREKHAIDPSVFAENPPFFWNAEISSNRVDAYYTIMQPSTLRNFSNAVKEGISFQNSHNTRELSLGRSLSGTYTGAQGNGVARVTADFYTIPGIKLGSISTDDFIKGVRSGIVRDVSVGFFGGDYICSVCGRNMMKDWQCTHWPGLSYEVKSGEGASAKLVERLCTAAIEDANLSEVSAVYDGATPSAMIQRANEAARDGRINDRQSVLIEQRYRIRLPDKVFRSTGSGVVVPATDVDVPAVETSEPDQSLTETTNEEISIPENKEETESTITSGNNVSASDIDTIIDASASDGSADVEIIENDLTRSLENDLMPTEQEIKLQERVNALETENQRLAPLSSDLDALKARVLELEPRARDGEIYRNDLIDQTLAEGVRAFGQDFDQVTYRALLSGVPLETVKRMKADWQKAGDMIFSGGRKTIDGVEGVEKVEKTDEVKLNSIPSAAFAG